MANHVFTMAEAENLFEIGRIVQHLFDAGAIEISDSKNVFMFAIKIAVQFEREYADTEDYYADIEYFVKQKIVEEFGNQV